MGLVQFSKFFLMPWIDGKGVCRDSESRNPQITQHNLFACVCVCAICLLMYIYIYVCVCVCMNFILYTCMKHLEKSQCFTFPGICMKYDGVKGGK